MGINTFFFAGTETGAASGLKSIARAPLKVSPACSVLLK